MPEKNLLITAHKSIVLQEENDEVQQVIVDGVPHDFPEPATDSSSKRAFATKLMREHYSEILRSHFENLIILTGAGSSVGFGGPLMKDLWQSVEEHFTEARFRIFCEKVGFDYTKKDLEGFLSRASVAKDFIALEGDESLADVISQCESIIYAKCKFLLPEDAPHVHFMNKVTNRKLKDPRVKVFTLNYDSLFEQASTKGNFTVIDGFSFTSPRTLSGRNFDYDIVYREKSRIKEEESFVPKVFHLYKPHGSINWKLEEGTGRVIIDDNPDKPLLIYPKDSKYENSYEQPFFEMMSRFQQNLRNDNVMLICIGFSFWDKHIVTAIKEAVEQNPSFRLLIVNPSISEPMSPFIELAKHQLNITYISEKFNDFAENYPFSPIYSKSFEKPKQLHNDEPSSV
ncbi:MAG: SIR2 family protein [Saprospiraceae bacterium]